MHIMACMLQRIDVAYCYRRRTLRGPCVSVCACQVAVRKALVCIGDSIFRGQPPVITWFRVVALFAVSAAVAREAVVNGNAHLVPVVVTTFTELVDRYLAVWIYRQGGWVPAASIFTELSKNVQNRRMLFLKVHRLPAAIKLKSFDKSEQRETGRASQRNFT